MRKVIEISAIALEIIHMGYSFAKAREISLSNPNTVPLISILYSKDGLTEHLAVKIDGKWWEISNREFEPYSLYLICGEGQDFLNEIKCER